MIPVLVPSVPSVNAASRYVRRSEEARHLSNFGPNVRDLESRLSERYGAHVVTVSSCTAGLELVYTLKLIQGYRKVELPSLTFIATWLAATRSGLQILPIDVDPQTFIAPGVAGYGMPSVGPVIDAAGAFGEQTVPKGSVAVFSLHATKPLGCGEGGFIVTHDRYEADDLRRMSNFGIEQGRSIGPGTNAKMSELHAAIALTALEQWDREPWLRLEERYRRYLPACARMQNRPMGVYSLMPVVTERPAVEVMAAMKEAGVETRQWYVPPCHEHPMFKKMGTRAERRKNPVKLPVTERLAKHLICLPYHLFLTEADVRQVCETLEQVCERELA